MPRKIRSEFTWASFAKSQFFVSYVGIQGAITLRVTAQKNSKKKWKFLEDKSGCINQTSSVMSV